MAEANSLYAIQIAEEDGKPVWASTLMSSQGGKTVVPILGTNKGQLEWVARSLKCEGVIQEVDLIIVPKGSNGSHSAASV